MRELAPVGVCNPEMLLQCIFTDVFDQEVFFTQPSPLSSSVPATLLTLNALLTTKSILLLSQREQPGLKATNLHLPTTRYFFCKEPSPVLKVHNFWAAF